jgi:hypothetical protein
MSRDENFLIALANAEDADDVITYEKLLNQRP